MSNRQTNTLTLTLSDPCATKRGQILSVAIHSHTDRQEKHPKITVRLTDRLTDLTTGERPPIGDSSRHSNVNWSCRRPNTLRNRLVKHSKTDRRTRRQKVGKQTDKRTIRLTKRLIEGNRSGHNFKFHSSGLRSCQGRSTHIRTDRQNIQTDGRRDGQTD